MDNLGRILGSFAPKFGVYFGEFGKGTDKKYRFTKHWGATLRKEAFPAIKQAIVELLQAAAQENLSRH